MADARESLHGMWSSRLAFVLAATGSAVGLGNIWRFPYVASENGGGAFVLVYLACIFMLGLPILMAEVMMGRRGRRSPINTLRELARESKASAKWQIIGWSGVTAGLLILSFYSVIAGWTLSYTWTYLRELVIPAVEFGSPDAVFGALTSSFGMLVFWHSLFMLMTLVVVSAGVEKGLERAVRFLMPTLFVLLLLLVGYGISTGYFGQAVTFLFKADFSRITPAVVVAAMGQAFFTLSLGMGSIMAYGAYLPSDASVGRTGAMVAVSDTFVAVVAGLAIFPIAFAHGLDPEGGGPGFIFTTLPHAFAAMNFGTLYAIAFFSLLSVAAWTSSISLMEPIVAYMVESWNVTRRTAAWMVGGLAWFIGLGSALSFNHWQDITLFGRTFFDHTNFISSDLLLPAGGMMIAVFAGWIMPRADSREEMSALADWQYQLWLGLVRYVAPVLVFVVLLSVSGAFDFLTAHV